jgi:hypothetical protein
MDAKRVNVTLDAKHADKLARLAVRAHVSDGTLARSLLSSAIDQADPDASTITQILEGIPGFAERLAASERQVERGEFVDIDEL